MKFKNFISPHVHIQSLDSASTPEKFAKREVELETGYVTVTDHGTLEAVRPVYDLLNDKYKNQLKIIPGLEGYFRDDDCPVFKEAGILKDKNNTYKEYLKYMHLTFHALDEPAFYTLTKQLSQADFRTEKHGSESKPLFNWANLEEMGAQNITVTSGCLIGMVSRHLLTHNDPHTAMKYYEKLRGMFKPGNFYVEVFPHVCDSNWESAIFLKFEDGTQQKVPSYKKLKTHAVTDTKGIEASALAKEFAKDPQKARNKHKAITEIKNYRKWEEIPSPKPLATVEAFEGVVYNECRPWCPDGDVQLGCNKFLIMLAKKYGDPLLISDDAHFAYPFEKTVQDVRLGQLGDWRMVNSHHRLTSDDAWQYFHHKLGISQSEFQEWVENSYNWASRFRDFSFSPRKALPTRFYPDDTLRHTFELIKKHGRFNPNDPAQVERLKTEIQLLHRNGTVDLLPYFFVLEEVCDVYRRNGELTGPGRGSAAGVFLTYLLGITHVDPLKYKLSLDRFLTLDRIQTGRFPDIDQDLPSRDLLVNPEDDSKGWLRDRFGDCYAQLSTNTSLKLKSAIKDTFRSLYGNTEPVNEICKALPNPPQGITDKDFVFGFKSAEGWTPGLLETSPVLQGFVKTYPKEWEIVQQLLGITRQKGRHASAYIISNDPIDSFIPMTTIGGVRVTQYTAGPVESSGGLKMDFLVINSLKDIGSAVRLIQDRHAPDVDWKPARLKDSEADVNRVIPSMEIDGKKVPYVQCVPFNGNFYDIWNLPQDEKVYADICTTQVETVFQMDAGAARQGLAYFAPQDNILPLKGIEDLAAFTALDRPGPLDAYVKAADGTAHNMLVEFANRALGREKAGALSVLNDLLPETYGIIVYQEQLQNIFQQVGGTTAIEANNFRQDISKKKMDKVIKHGEKFMAGAIPKMGEEQAKALWSSMETFGQYGFNKSHAVCYVTISYACAWLKRHYPLEWWTAVLSNATRDDIDTKFWKYCSNLIDLPDIRLSGANFEIQNERIRAPLWLLHGLGDKAHQQLMQGAPYSDVEDLLLKIEKWKEDNATSYDDVDDDGNKITKKRKATTALNNKVLLSLIISGTMDSIFPEVDANGRELLIQDRITIYEKAVAKVKNKKKYKGTASMYDGFTKLSQYQLRKSVLPAYTDDLVPHCIEARPDLFDKNDKGNNVILKSYDDGKIAPFRIINAQQFEALNRITLKVPDLKVALLGYVVSDRRFTYTKKDTGENRTASELTLEVNGHRISFVKWPNKYNQLPDAFANNLDEAVVGCLLTRSGENTDFFLADVILVAENIKKQYNTHEETSNEERIKETEGN